MTLISTETLRAPWYRTKATTDRRGEPRDGLTKEATGYTFETVFRVWKCRCGKRAVTVGTFGPAPVCCG